MSDIIPPGPDGYGGVEYEQRGQARADDGQALLERWSVDLAARVGRGLGLVKLQQTRNFHRCRPSERIYRTASDKSTGHGILQAPSALSSADPISETRSRRSSTGLPALAQAFPLPWSAHVRLLPVKLEPARRFCLAELEKTRRELEARQAGRNAAEAKP